MGTSAEAVKKHFGRQGRMELPKVLSLSTDRDLAMLRERAQVLELAGFDVVSVTSAWQAMLEIMRGHYGIFISCPLLSELSAAELFKVFKERSQDGISVFVIRDGPRSAVYRDPTDIQVHESFGPSGIVAALLAHLKPKGEPSDLADSA